eukprot:scaffold201796_cov17-Tisochrysis_lutea.AAC.1
MDLESTRKVCVILHLNGCPAFAGALQCAILVVLTVLHNCITAKFTYIPGRWAPSQAHAFL